MHVSEDVMDEPKVIPGRPPNPPAVPPPACASNDASFSAFYLRFLQGDPDERRFEHTGLLPALADGAVWEQRQGVFRVRGALLTRERQVLAWTLDGYTRTKSAAIRACA
jgi:hypothetical protein